MHTHVHAILHACASKYTLHFTSMQALVTLHACTARLGCLCPWYSQQVLFTGLPFISILVCHKQTNFLCRCFLCKVLIAISHKCLLIFNQLPAKKQIWLQKDIQICILVVYCFIANDIQTNLHHVARHLLSSTLLGSANSHITKSRS